MCLYLPAKWFHFIGRYWIIHNGHTVGGKKKLLVLHIQEYNFTFILVLV